MIKLIFVVILLLSLLGIQPAKADNAIGIVLGDPTGVSGRFSLDSAHSFEAALAYSSSYYEGMHLHATYLWDNARNFRTAQSPLEMYYGLGVRVLTINKGEREKLRSVRVRLWGCCIRSTTPILKSSARFLRPWMSPLRRMWTWI